MVPPPPLILMLILLGQRASGGAAAGSRQGFGRQTPGDDGADEATGLRASTSAPICSNFSLGNVCCSLNGELKGESCVCDRPWHGDNCEMMRFKPHDRDGQPAYGTPPLFDSSGKRTYYGNFTWGGNPVHYNEMFHLFVSAMPAGTNLSNWGESLVDHAISPNITGPYVYNQTTLTPGHNPAIIKLTNGSFALFSILDYGVHTSLTPYGPWTKVVQAVDCKVAHQPLCYCKCV